MPKIENPFYRSADAASLAHAREALRAYLVDHADQRFFTFAQLRESISDIGALNAVEIRRVCATLHVTVTE